MNDAINSLTYKVIGAAISVHQEIGPGLEEADYELGLCEELQAQQIPHQTQQPMPVVYKGIRLDAGYRIDVPVGSLVIVELKSVERIHPVHEAQLLTYLRLSNRPVGLLINFDVPVLKDGIMRRVMSKAPPVEMSARSEPSDLNAHVIDAAIEVHAHLEPGLLRSAYDECLCHELALRGIAFERKKQVPVKYRDVTLPKPAEVDIVVEGQLPVMVVANSERMDLNEARFIGRLKNGAWETGLLFNFGEKTLKNGLRRIVNPQL